MSAHIYPTTQTRLAGELNTLVSQMQDVHARAEKLKLILDQIAIGGDYALYPDDFTDGIGGPNGRI